MTTALRTVVLDNRQVVFRGDVILLNREDTSPTVIHHGDNATAEYNENCSRCYLGHGHSVNYHHAALADRERRMAEWERK